MSAKFRANSRRYRVGSGGYSRGSRPMTASSTSMDESYHSDFEALENNVDDEKSNFFFTGESIGDKLNLSAEFNVGGSVLEEDEDIADETKSGGNYPPLTPLEDNNYEEDFFEIFSPPQSGEKPVSVAVDEAKNTESIHHQQPLLNPITEENPTLSSTLTADTTIAENNLAEFSSITFGNSTIEQEKKISKKKLFKVPTKKRNGTPGLPTIKSPRNQQQSQQQSKNTPRSANTSKRSKVTFQKNDSLPPRPSSFPSKPTNRRLNLKTHSQNEEDDQFDQTSNKGSPKSHFKFQRVPVTTESSVVGKPSISTFSYYNSGSVVTRDASTVQNASEVQKLYKQTLKQLNEAREKNKILQEKLDQSNIQELIQSYLYAIRQKDIQIEKLTSENTSMKTIMKNQEKSLMKYDFEKQNEFNLLENQEKDIEVLYEQMKKVKQKMFIYKEKDLEKELIIEDLKAAIQKYKSKNLKLKKLNDQYEKHIQEYQVQLEKKQSGEGEIPEEHENGSIISGIKDSVTTQKVSLLTIMTKETEKNRPLQQNENDGQTVHTSLLAEKVEKSYLTQIKLLQYDITKLKNQLKEKDEKFNALNQELNKRELFIKYQTNILESLKFSFHDLSENNHHLFNSIALLGRDQKKPIEKPKKIAKPLTPKMKPKKKDAQLVSDEFPLPPEENLQPEDNPLADILNSYQADQQQHPEGHGSMMNDDNEVVGDEQEENNAFFITEDQEYEEGYEEGDHYYDGEDEDAGVEEES